MEETAAGDGYKAAGNFVVLIDGAVFKGAMAESFNPDDFILVDGEEEEWQKNKNRNKLVFFTSFHHFLLLAIMQPIESS